ncbi:MAG: hypothetical protein K0U84_06335 [Actinomycetia bacterium]|nr:hypothetical protein [Actinomycetes bacterium]
MPLLRRSAVTPNTCGNRSVAIVIVDNDGRARWAALPNLTAPLPLTARASLSAAGITLSAAALSTTGVALSAAALSAAAGTALTAATAATAAATGRSESESGITCGCAENQRAGNETCPEYPNSAT